MKLINIKKADNSETNDLAKNIVNGQDKFLTINQGLRINDDQNSLKSGERGTTSFRSLFCL
jgi:catalase